MGFRLAFDIEAPAETVLAALRENTREWRESVIPSELRARHVVQVAGTLTRRRFRWCFDCAGRHPCPDVVLRGEVEPRPGGRSVMRVWCGRAGPPWPATLRYALGVAVLIGALFVIEDGVPSTIPEVWGMAKALGWIAVILVGATALSNLFRWDRTDVTSEPARYLVERLRTSIAEAERLARAGRGMGDQAV
jgi:hypothetical protein